jgi:hypothetical protein
MRQGFVWQPTENYLAGSELFPVFTFVADDLFVIR